jgi:hypothetical protein
VVKKRFTCKRCGILKPLEDKHPYRINWLAYGAYPAGMGVVCRSCHAENEIPRQAQLEEYEKRWAETRAQHEREAERRREEYAKTLVKDVFDSARFAALPKDEDQGGSLLRETFEIEEKPTDVYTSFDSVTEFLASLKRESIPQQADSHERTEAWDALQQGPHRIFYDGNATGEIFEGMTQGLPYAQIKAFWQGGWQEGADKMLADLDRMDVPETRDIRRRGRWADTGAELSVERLFGGAFDQAWRTSSRKAIIAPVRVRVVVDIGSSCGQCNQLTHDAEVLDAGALFWRGAAAVALTDSLERAGYGVEVVVACAAHKQGVSQAGLEIMRQQSSTGRLTGRLGDQSYNRRIECGGVNALAVTVKPFDGPVDLALLASTTASASFFRRAYLLHSLIKTPYFQPGYCYGWLLRVENTPVVRKGLNLDTEGVATLYVSDWVLSAKQANAWARAAHLGLESVNNPEAVAQEAEEYGEEYAQ